MDYYPSFLDNFIPGEIIEYKLKNMLKLGLKAHEILKFLSKFIKLKPITL